MRKAFLQIFAAVGLAIPSAVVSAQAEYRANTPFDFDLGHKNYKAGEYFVVLPGSDLQRVSVTVKLVGESERDNQQ